MKKHLTPVVIGGVGGSGTRLVAQCLKKMGFFIGDDLNIENDNLWFTLLFRRVEILYSSESEFDELVDVFLKGMTGCGDFTKAQVDLINKIAYLNRDIFSAEWFLERAKSLLSAKRTTKLRKRWGWKEPNSHIIIDRLKQTIPNMKYIHVMRNGLDMAHSSNQNQLKLWGEYFMGPNYRISPFHSLRYWCIVHRRILKIGASMEKDFFLLNFDNFTTHPKRGTEELLQFLEIDATEAKINKLSKLIELPNSIGRFRQYGIEIFDEGDVAYVNQLGFSIE